MQPPVRYGLDGAIHQMNNTLPHTPTTTPLSIYLSIFIKHIYTVVNSIEAFYSPAANRVLPFCIFHAISFFHSTSSLRASLPRAWVSAITCWGRVYIFMNSSSHNIIVDLYCNFFVDSLTGCCYSYEREYYAVDLRHSLLLMWNSSHQNTTERKKVSTATQIIVSRGGGMLNTRTTNNWRMCVVRINTFWIGSPCLETGTNSP